MIVLSTGTRSINDKGIFALVPEEEVTNSETNDDSYKDSTVEGHNRQHQQIPDRRTQPKQNRSGDLHAHLRTISGELPPQQRGLDLCREGLSGADKLEANTAVLENLIENGNEEACEESKEIFGPIIGLP